MATTVSVESVRQNTCTCGTISQSERELKVRLYYRPSTGNYNYNCKFIQRLFNRDSSTLVDYLITFMTG